MYAKSASALIAKPTQRPHSVLIAKPAQRPHSVIAKPAQRPQSILIAKPAQRPPRGPCVANKRPHRLLALFAYWITTDETDVGLWSLCAKGSCDSTIETFVAGQSPAYFELVRGFSVVSVLAHFVLIFAFVANSESRTPLILVFLVYGGSMGVTVGVLAAHYETDPRWQDANPRLGGMFWLACACLAVVMLNFIGVLVSHPDVPTPPAGPGGVERRRVLCCCHLGSPRHAPPRRTSNASSISLASGKTIKIFSLAADNPAFVQRLSGALPHTSDYT